MIRAGARGFPRVRRRFLSVVAWWRRLDARHSVLRLSPRRLPRVYTTCALECACAAAEDHQDGEDVATDEVATKLRQLAVRNITSGIVGRTTGKACDGAGLRSYENRDSESCRCDPISVDTNKKHRARPGEHPPSHGPSSPHPRASRQAPTPRASHHIALAPASIASHPRASPSHPRASPSHPRASRLAPARIAPRTRAHRPSHPRASPLAPARIALAPARIAPRTRAHRPRTREHRPSHRVIHGSSAASTSSTCPSTFTLSQRRCTLPSAPIRYVVRTMPKYLRP